MSLPMTWREPQSVDSEKHKRKALARHEHVRKSKTAKMKSPKWVTTQGVHLLSVIRRKEYLKLSVWNTKSWPGIRYLMRKCVKPGNMAWVNGLSASARRNLGDHITQRAPHPESPACPDKTLLRQHPPRPSSTSQRSSRKLQALILRRTRTRTEARKFSLCSDHRMFESSSDTQRLRASS